MNQKNKYMITFSPVNCIILVSGKRNAAVWACVTQELDGFILILLFYIKGLPASIIAVPQ